MYSPILSRSIHRAIFRGAAKKKERKRSRASFEIYLLRYTAASSSSSSSSSFSLYMLRSIERISWRFFDSTAVLYIYIMAYTRALLHISRTASRALFYRAFLFFYIIYIVSDRGKIRKIYMYTFYITWMREEREREVESTHGVKMRRREKEPGSGFRERQMSGR